MAKLSQLEVVGIILWWAEGSKSRRDVRWKNAVTYPVEVTNTDPRIIKIFLRLLREKIQIDEDRIKVQIQVHEGDSKAALENYWSEVTKIPISRFQKTIVRPIGKKVGKTKGTCKIRCSGKEIYVRLQALQDQVIEGL